MSPDRVRIIREGIEALNAGDWNAILPHLTEDVVLDNSRALGEQRGIYHGPGEVRRVWEWTADVWESVRTEPVDVKAVGEHVVAPQSGRFRGRQGIELSTRITWLFTFRGDKVAHICVYQDEQEALDAAKRC